MFSFEKSPQNLVALPNVGGALLGDDPRLYSTIEKQLSARLREGLPTGELAKEYRVPHLLIKYLLEGLELKHARYLVGSEGLNRMSLMSFLNNLAHLDFRSFSSSGQQELSLYDPEVITPYSSWLIEQIFQNLAVFFNVLTEFESRDDDLKNAHVDIIRNVFILGYLHGFLNDNQKNTAETRRFLARSIRASQRADSNSKIKSYPEFLQRIAADYTSDDASSRLLKLKGYWLQQLALRLGISLRESGENSLLTLATQRSVNRSLPTDRRPAANKGAARKMDRKQEGPTSAKIGPVELEQSKEEAKLLRFTRTLKKLSTAYMKEVLDMYSIDRKIYLEIEVLTEPILYVLTSHSKSLLDAKNDESIDAILSQVVQEMIQRFNLPNFNNISTVEQVTLISFVALSHLTDLTNDDKIKLAIRTLDKVIVPRLSRYFDLEETSDQSSLESNLPLSPYNELKYVEQSQQALAVLNNLQASDGLLSMGGEEFQRLFKQRQKLLSVVSKMYTFFASLVTENEGAYNARKNTLIYVLAFLMISGISISQNFKLSQQLLTSSFDQLYAKDPWTIVLNLLILVLAMGSGSLLLGDTGSRKLKEFNFSSAQLENELRKLATGGIRKGLTISFLAAYSLISLFPFLQDATKDWKIFHGDANSDPSLVEQQSEISKITDLLESRTPEDVNPEDLRKIEKSVLGKLEIEPSVGVGMTSAPIGFTNTAIVSPVLSESGDSEAFESRLPDTMDTKYQLASGLIIYASSYQKTSQGILFSLSSGERFLQPNEGVDFVISVDPPTDQKSFPYFPDTGRYIDKIIAVPVNGVSETSYQPSFATYEKSFERYGSFGDAFPEIKRIRYKYFVVYRKDLAAINEMDKNKINLHINLKYWKLHASDRKIVQETLQEENPQAAAMYAQMVIEQQKFWESEASQHDPASYLQMIRLQIATYDAFVRNNHVYSLRYKPETHYVELYPNVGVLLDVMSLKSGGYYCMTAHLAAQQWFLSLGLPMDGLLGFSVYDDQGVAKTRLGHEKTGLYGAIYDFTPSNPNPGEDLSSLAFDLNQVDEIENEQNLELLRKILNKDVLTSIIILFVAILSGKSIQMIATELKGRLKKSGTDDVEKLEKSTPDNERVIRGLSLALLHIFNSIIDFEQVTSGVMKSKESSSRISEILADSLRLATSSVTDQFSSVRSMSLNPLILTLLQKVGLNELGLGSASSNLDTDNEADFDSLLKKLSEGDAQKMELLSEILLQLGNIVSDFEKKRNQQESLARSKIRTLQRQLFAMRKKEHAFYGLYGKLLYETHLIEDLELAALRQRITTAYTSAEYTLHEQQKILDELKTQKKLLPLITNGMRKILKFIISSKAEIRL